MIQLVLEWISIRSTTSTRRKFWISVGRQPQLCGFWQAFNPMLQAPNILANAREPSMSNTMWDALRIASPRQFSLDVLGSQCCRAHFVVSFDLIRIHRWIKRR